MQVRSLPETLLAHSKELTASQRRISDDFHHKSHHATADVI
jgi:hypothetical protein